MSHLWLSVEIIKKKPSNFVGNPIFPNSNKGTNLHVDSVDIFMYLLNPTAVGIKHILLTFYPCLTYVTKVYLW